MNRIAARIASGTITALLVLGGAATAQAVTAGPDQAGQPATTAARAAADDHRPTSVVVDPLTNDWG
ncbi:hypothetical protein ABZ990_04740 [Streptomyces sp. NPDC046203]|uniref:hypothetical protein n=1 Tax=Streptomyces sp. NPDC046203 TaxID=3154602 RepID=UPI0033F510DC